MLGIAKLRDDTGLMNMEDLHHQQQLLALWGLVLTKGIVYVHKNFRCKY